MKYFFDTEYIEDFHKPLFGRRRHFIDLISIGIVAEDGREYYAVSKDFDLLLVWDRYDLKQDFGKPQGLGDTKIYWLRENVLRPIFDDLRIKSLLDANYTKNHFATAADGFTYHHMASLIKWYGKTNAEIAQDIVAFCYPEQSRDIPKPEFLDRAIRFGWNAPHPEFYAYFADYDWVLFCSLFGRMIDLPNGFPMYCRDLKQMLDEKAQYAFENCVTGWEPNPAIKGDIRPNKEKAFKTFDEALAAGKANPNYPAPYTEHNALADARWNRELYNFLTS